MVFSLYIILDGWTDFCVFSCVLFCSFLILYFCVCAFMLLCSILCFIGNIVTIISYHERPARWIIPFWQSAYPVLQFTESDRNWPNLTKSDRNWPNLTQQGTLYTHSVKSSFSCLSFGCTSTVFKVLYGFIAIGTLCFLIILGTASETFST